MKSKLTSSWFDSAAAYFPWLQSGCSHFERIVSLAGDGMATSAEVAELKEHLNTCASCRSLAQTLNVTRIELRSRPVAQMPAGLSDRLMAAIDLERQRERDRQRVYSPGNLRLAGAAAAFVAIAVLVLHPASHIVKTNNTVHLAANPAASVAVNPVLTTKLTQDHQHSGTEVADLPKTHDYSSESIFIQPETAVRISPEHKSTLGSNHSEPAFTAPKTIVLNHLIDKSHLTGPMLANRPKLIPSPASGHETDIAPVIKTSEPNNNSSAPVEVASQPDQSSVPITLADNSGSHRIMFADLARQTQHTSTYFVTLAASVSPNTHYSGTQSIVGSSFH